MNTKLRETTKLCVEIMNRIKRQLRGNLITWYKFSFAVRHKPDAQPLF